MNKKNEIFFVSAAQTIKQSTPQMDYEGFLVSERIKEIMTMCARKNPIYDQISSFSVALYTLGFVNCPDMMSFRDVSADEAAGILKEHFFQIKPKELPVNYQITESKEKYLLVIGDPLFPLHFAVLADTRSPRPFFSKLPFFGSGFDSLEDLIDEFTGIDGVTRNDFRYFKKTWYGQIPPSSVGKIYIVKND